LRNSNRKRERRIATWQIIRRRGTPAAFTGLADTPDEASAVQAAIKNSAFGRRIKSAGNDLAKARDAFACSGYGGAARPCYTACPGPQARAEPIPALGFRVCSRDYRASALAIERRRH